METKKKTLVNISKKTLIQVSLLLLGLLAASIILTYIVPRGEFGVLADGSPDYLTYRERPDLSGIPILQGIFAPVLVFFSSDGLTLFMLALFLIMIAGAFQVMDDAGGIRSIVGAVSARFQHRAKLLLVLMSLLFYSFGSFMGIFEEMLTMLPIVASLCVLLGFDSFTGFLCCILSCGFGFAGSVTNPFTVLLASEIIGVNPLEHIWYRLVIFAVMFLLLMGFLFLYLRRLAKDPASSPTFARDERLRKEALSADSTGASRQGIAPADSVRDAGSVRVRRVYTFFLLCALALIILCSVVPALRSYTVPILIAYFLICGITAGLVSGLPLKTVLRSFGRGIVSALPAIVFIAFAASVKFVFDQGAILPTIVHQINTAVEGRNLMAVAFIIYLIVLVLEFFISSSTAKVILVMGLLSVMRVGLSKPLLVLIYTFADGYTNVLFPTSAVLLISLSMLELDYFTWIKRTWVLFLLNFLLVIGFILLGIVIHY